MGDNWWSERHVRAFTILFISKCKTIIIINVTAIKSSIVSQFPKFCLGYRLNQVLVKFFDQLVHLQVRFIGVHETI